MDTRAQRPPRPAPPLALPPEGVLARRFHVVTGKGGVGKSAVSLALGLALAARGRRVLLCEVDERERLTRAFGLPPSAGELAPLWGPPGALWGVSVEQRAALSEYGALKLKVRALSSLLTENPLTRALLTLVPGVGDLLAFGKAFHHEREQERGRPRWDHVILDAPATGHGLTFLSLPRVIASAVPAGNLRREADEMWALVSDPRRCALHVVATPEEMATEEAAELCGRLEGDLGARVGALWLNRAPWGLDELGAGAG
ncbi:MAG: chromosome partitioning protein, partial [Deltaproteobacteria bacterium]|nr:chromosome partitioning protein [Deltaproteobacteria bacterium]